MLMTRVLFRFDSVQHYTQSLNELLAHLRPQLLERRKRYFQEEAGLLTDGVRDDLTLRKLLDDGCTDQGLIHFEELLGQPGESINR